MGEFADDALDRDVDAIFEVINDMTQFSEEEISDTMDDYDAACAAMHQSNYSALTLFAPTEQDARTVMAESEAAIYRPSGCSSLPTPRAIKRSAKDRLHEIERRVAEREKDESTPLKEGWFQEGMPSWAE